MDSVAKDLESAYVPFDLAVGIREWNQGADVGISSRAAELDKVLKHKRGTVNGWYGWPNDGKGTMYDYQAILSAMFDNWKFCMFKREDMSSHRYDGRTTIDSVDILHNLMWTYTGKTPFKHIAQKYHQPQLTKEEYVAAHSWISDHFYIINPKDRRAKSIFDVFRFMYDKYGIDRFLIDPYRCVHMEGSDKEDRLNRLFDDSKEFVMQTNTILDYIAHPKALTEVKVSKKEDAAYKVVDQFMISGGASWDNAMDSQYSIYRPERHLDPTDPKVEFHNLKQRKAEIVGANRGIYRHIVFDFLEKRYYFNGICPITNKAKQGKHVAPEQTNIFETKMKDKKDVPVDTDGAPF